jgi:hypothetical protein
VYRLLRIEEFSYATQRFVIPQPGVDIKCEQCDQSEHSVHLILTDNSIATLYHSLYLYFLSHSSPSFSSPRQLHHHQFLSTAIMQLHYFTIISLLPLALSKPCTFTPPRPLSCDHDRWHQERKVLLGTSRPVDVQCYSLGRNVQGGPKWLYVSDKKCWAPAGIFGRGCGGKCWKEWAER